MYGASYAKVNPEDEAGDGHGNSFEIVEQPHRGTVIYYG
jgi:hypothetical protein